MAARSLVLVASLAIACACGGGAGRAPADAGVDAPPAIEGPPLSGSVTADVTSVSMTETDGTTSDVRLELAITNGTPTAVNNAGVVNAHVFLGNAGFNVSLARVPADPLAPILSGETRALAFEGRVVSLSVCTSSVRATPNPHRGLVTFGVTVVTEVSGVAFTGVPVDVTCPEAVPDAGVAIPCTQSVASACASPGMPGQFNIHCSPTWDDAVADTFYCGTAVTDIVYGCEGYDRRSSSPGGGAAAFFYDYYYGRGSGELVAVIARTSATTEICAGGPPTGFVLPICTDPPQTKPGCPPGDRDGGAAEVRSSPGDGP